MSRLRSRMLMMEPVDNTPSPLLTDLISYWKMDEASGNAIDAVTASANDLTDNNTVTTAAGKVGTSRQFTAANSESLSKASNASLQTGNIDFTVAFWVYFDSLPAFAGLIDKGGWGVDEEFWIDYESGAGLLRLGTVSTVIASATTFGTISTGTWYFVVADHDAANNLCGISVNAGTRDTGAEAADITASTGQFNIGVHGNLGRYHDGRIDEVGFWKRLLTADERTQLYNGGNGVTYPNF